MTNTTTIAQPNNNTSHTCIKKYIQTKKSKYNHNTNNKSNYMYKLNTPYIRQVKIIYSKNLFP